ncbi:hypothetical protein [Patulibacter defluvii]|uniref:hypothetical protein n=1 Tax=Patulibacter defluvii TaxID=3095358 RepID=UPI002A754F56|nr:hypothetical protein [Patulibacter sp. DM4]
MRTFSPSAARRARRLAVSAVAALSATLAMAGPASAAPALQTCTPEQTRATQRHWFFGTRGHIDFGTTGNTATASVGTKSAVEGATVVTDTSGELLFWSNGQQVYDRNSDVMPNGTGLLGNDSATQTVAAFPAIGHPGRYFVVTTSAEATVNHGSGPGKGDLTYSVVDMTANGGLGEVTATKNVALGAAGTASEAITAVPNDDGTGFWVITNTQGGPEVLAYEFDENGPVTGTAVVSTMPDNNFNGFGSLSVSPDLKRVALMSGNVASGSQPARLRLMDFDATTGALTQTAEWDTATANGSNGYYADFSPSGDYLYATRIFGGASLLRYDISDPSDATGIKASEQFLGAIGNGGAVRLAPDGKMYVANRGAATLSTIDAPDDATDPQLQLNGYALPSGSASGWGLAQAVTGCAQPLDPPSVTVTGPTDGAEYYAGQDVPAAYTCEGANGAAITSCEATTPNGQPIDTTTPGTHTFTVKATDEHGKVTEKTVTYTVRKSKAGMRIYPSILAVLPAKPGKGLLPLVPLARVTLTFAARLTDEGGKPVVGENVTFTGAGGSCTAKTDADGVANCGDFVNGLVSLLSLGYTARFNGSATQDPAAGHGYLIEATDLGLRLL